MIARLCEAGRAQFLSAVRGRPYFGDVLPVHLAVFGMEHPRVRFFTAGPDAAVQLRGQSAALCGTYDREEMGAFLRMQGVRAVTAAAAPPDGYRRVQTLHNLAWRGQPCAAAPCPDAARLVLERAPAPGEVADFLMRGAQDADARDNFYSELCVKLARGAALVWAVRREGRLVATAGAYALSPAGAYLAAVETDAALRGQGVGSWLTGLLTARLAAGGRRVALTCARERLQFYARLGFVQEDAIFRCVPREETEKAGHAAG